MAFRTSVNITVEMNINKNDYIFKIISKQPLKVNIKNLNV